MANLSIDRRLIEGVTIGCYILFLVLDSTSLQPVLVGSVEGKRYFYETAEGLNWTQSKELCNAAGLDLATITTETQLSFLKEANREGKLPSRWYWLGARESRQWSMLAWDSTGDELPSMFTGRLDNNLPPDLFYVCLVYSSGIGNLLADECSVPLNGHPLCEI